MARRSSVWALAALQAAVTLSWMAYAYHQPRLLAHFGFEALSGILGWYLALAGTTLAPLAGDASDRLVRSGGDRFPVVRAGVFLAGASFVAVAVTAAAEGGSPIRWLLPLFVALWIAGMTIFQAPALAIVRDENGPLELRSASVPIVLATVGPMALWPLVERALASAGGSLTFLAGGAAIVGTAYALGSTAAVPFERPDVDVAESSNAGRAFFAGLASAMGVVLASDLVPARLALRSGLDPSWLAALAMIAATVAVGCAGARIARWTALFIGLGVVGFAVAGAPLVDGPIAAGGVAIVTGVALGAVMVAALPYALGAASIAHAGLATGLYVAGAMLGAQVVRWLVAMA
jgi:hypothetical protein